MNMTKDTHVRLSTDQHERIKKAAHDRGVSISTYIRWAALEAAASWTPMEVSVVSGPEQV